MKKIEEDYRTIKGQEYSEFEEEKSIFMTTAKYVESEKDALQFIEEISDKYKDATHNCHAYIINQIPEIKRYSDDGEPQGSAGLPMLSVLEKEDVKNVAVVVTRYYGGKKLGKGGLIRAYTRGVADCIKDKILYKRPFYEVKLTHAYTVLGQIENFLNERKYRIIKKDFLDTVKITLYIREDEFKEFEKTLIDMTSANIDIEILDKIMLYD